MSLSRHYRSCGKESWERMPEAVSSVNRHKGYQWGRLFQLPSTESLITDGGEPYTAGFENCFEKPRFLGFLKT